MCNCNELKDLRLFFYNKKLNSLAIVVRSAKSKNYGENIKYHNFL